MSEALPTLILITNLEINQNFTHFLRKTIFFLLSYLERFFFPEYTFFQHLFQGLHVNCFYNILKYISSIEIVVKDNLE